MFEAVQKVSENWLRGTTDHKALGGGWSLKDSEWSGASAHASSYRTPGGGEHCWLKGKWNRAQLTDELALIPGHHWFALMPSDRTRFGLIAHFVSLLHLPSRALCWTVGVSTRATVAAGNQLWGIYCTDREYAHLMGDPLRTVVEAPTKLAAEEAAARLGFSEPWAHPIRPEEVQRTEWLPKRNHSHRQEVTRKPSRDIHI